MNVSWPVSDAALLAWSELLLTWVVAMYFVGSTESLWARVQPAAAPRWGSALLQMALPVFVPVIITGRRPLTTIVLAILGALLSGALLLARGQTSDRWRTRGAELEIGTTAAYAALSAVTLGNVATDRKSVV